MYLVFSSRPQQGENEHQADGIHDGRGDALVDGVRRGLPGQAVPVPVELQPVGEFLGMLASPDELYNGGKLLVDKLLFTQSTNWMVLSGIP